MKLGTIGTGCCQVPNAYRYRADFSFIVPCKAGFIALYFVTLVPSSTLSFLTLSHLSAWES